MKKTSLNGCFRKPTAAECESIAAYYNRVNKGTIKFANRASSAFIVGGLVLMISSATGAGNETYVMIGLGIVCFLLSFVLMFNKKGLLIFNRKMVNGCFDLLNARVTDTSPEALGVGSIKVWVASIDGSFDAGWYAVPTIGIDIGVPVIVIRVVSDNGKKYEYRVKPV